MKLGKPRSEAESNEAILPRPCSLRADELDLAHTSQIDSIANRSYQITGKIHLIPLPNRWKL
jgi:hypothetical protein